MKPPQHRGCGGGGVETGVSAVIPVAFVLLLCAFVCIMLFGPYYQERAQRVHVHSEFLRSGYCDTEILRHLQRVKPARADLYAGVHVKSASFKDIDDVNCAKAIAYTSANVYAGAVSDAVQDLNLYKCYAMLLNTDTWESHAAIWVGWLAAWAGAALALCVASKTFVQMWWAGSLSRMLDRRGEQDNTLRVGTKRIAVIPVRS